MLRTRVALITILTLGLVLPTSAQIRTPNPRGEYSGAQLTVRSTPSTRTSSRIALEEPVDRNVYRLVPGDRLSLGIWGERPQLHDLEVTPEGDILIPESGPVPVTGQSLAEAEITVQRQLHRLYPGSRVTLGLREPGRFRVAVIGAVVRPGWYELTGLDRISAALAAAGGLRPGGSERFLRIHDQLPSPTADQAPVPETQKSREVDLLPWLLSADLAANPHLEPGWRIEVPPRKGTVTVIGAVNGRGPITELALADEFEAEPVHAIEWRPGDTIEYALEVAGGLSAEAEGAIDVVRPDGTIQRLDRGNRTDLQLILEEGDRLEVAYRQRWVYVVGAVRRPGRYPQYAGYDAHDYILMAGGETENGSQQGWTLTLPGETEAREDLGIRIEAGSTLRVPERRSYWMTRVITPIASAVAVGISIAILLR